jgi:hypothetical protein
MRAGIVVTVTPDHRRRLEAVVRDRNRLQKHVWRARIMLLTADGLGTNGIAELQEAINRFIEEHNAEPKPFVRTADPDAIVAAVDRGRKVLESIH